MNIQITTHYPLTTYDLYDDTVKHISLIGKGFPNVKRVSDDPVGLDGEIDIGYNIEPRNMQLKFALRENNKIALESKIDQLYQIFRPNNSDFPLKLKYTRDDSSVREILCHLNGQFEVADEENFGSTLKTVVVPLVCPNPIWYDPVQKEHEIIIGSSFATYSFPDYEGSWYEYPVIHIHGQITSCTIRINYHKKGSDGVTNTSLEHEFTISGTIPNGEYYIVDLRPGQKTVYDDSGVNKIDSVYFYNGTFGHWRIDPDPFLNDLQISYSSKNANAKIEIFYYDRYIGA